MGERSRGRGSRGQGVEKGEWSRGQGVKGSGVKDSRRARGGNCNIPHVENCVHESVKHR